MPNSHPKEALRREILALEAKRQIELFELKQQFNTTYESLKPINLIKDVFHQMSSSSDLKNDLAEAGIGITSGYFIKKLIIGSSQNPLKLILGNLIQFVGANVIAKHADPIKNTLKSLYKSFLPTK